MKHANKNRQGQLLDDSMLDSADEDYKFACENLEERQFIEKLWDRYWEHADKKFNEKIAKKFSDHFWEMYLACALIDNGKKLFPKIQEEGPDIKIESKDFTHIWVEATTAKPGTGQDKVPQRPDGEKGFSVPEKQIVLRYTNAIDKKLNQYNKYTNNENGNVVKKSEAFIIAVNGSKVPYAWDSDGDIPYIVQAVFPIGLPIFKTNSESPKKSSSGYENRHEIQKVSGAYVPTNSFLKKKYEGISGILFSRVDIRNLNSEMGEDFIFVHNPFALNKLPVGWLKVGREYRVEKIILECTHWSK